VLLMQPPHLTPNHFTHTHSQTATHLLQLTRIMTTHPSSQKPATHLLQLARHLLQARRRDPAGRVARVGVDDRLEQQAGLFDVANLSICRGVEEVRCR